MYQPLHPFFSPSPTIIHAGMEEALITSIVKSLLPGNMILLENNLSTEQVKAAASALGLATQLHFSLGCSEEMVRTAASCLKPSVALVLPPLVNLGVVMQATTALPPHCTLIFSEYTHLSVVEGITQLKPDTMVLLKPNTNIDFAKGLAESLPPGTTIGLVPYPPDTLTQGVARNLKPQTTLLIHAGLHPNSVQLAACALQPGTTLCLPTTLPISCILLAKISLKPHVRLVFPAAEPVEKVQEITRILDSANQDGHRKPQPVSASIFRPLYPTHPVAYASDPGSNVLPAQKPPLSRRTKPRVSLSIANLIDACEAQLSENRFTLLAAENNPQKRKNREKLDDHFDSERENKKANIP